MTPLESPTLATINLFPSNKATSAVEPIRYEQNISYNFIKEYLTARRKLEKHETCLF